jgi:hypothetical protein
VNDYAHGALEALAWTLTLLEETEDLGRIRRQLEGARDDLLAGELALRGWIRKNRSQVSLETWTEARGNIAPVNRALISVQVTIVKAELREILDELEIVKAEYQLEILRKLQKLMPTAQALVEETRDKELGEVLTAVAAKVTLQAN